MSSRLTAGGGWGYPHPPTTARYTRGSLSSQISHTPAGAGYMHMLFMKVRILGEQIQYIT